MTEQLHSAAFDDFYDNFCQEDTPVAATIDNQQAAAPNVFLYGQLSDDKRILIMRSGVHKSRLFHWMATFDSSTGGTVHYEPITEFSSGYDASDHRITASHGMNAAYVHIESARSLDGRHTVGLSLSSHTLRWYDEHGEQSIVTPPSIYRDR